MVQCDSGDYRDIMSLKCPYASNRLHEGAFPSAGIMNLRRSPVYGYLYLISSTSSSDILSNMVIDERAIGDDAKPHFVLNYPLDQICKIWSKERFSATQRNIHYRHVSKLDEELKPLLSGQVRIINGGIIKVIAIVAS